MDYRKLYEIALNFRKAIMEVKWNSDFHNLSDTMNHFPHGCCDDSADLFGYYLQHKHNIQSEQGNGIYRDDDPDNTTNHAFTILKDGTIIDLTADQFSFFSDYLDGVYVGPENDFYLALDRRRKFPHYDITHDQRILHDYKAIIEYL